MYEKFAALYDALMDDVDYDAWAEYYLRLIERAGVRPATVCDCACGTGAMTLEFARRGLKATGVDLSTEMLEEAARKARQAGRMVPFVRQDMCRLELPRPVDCLVCACDGVNYLLNAARLREFFAAAHAAIRPGGCLAFDCSTPYKLERVLGDNLFFEEREDAAVYWKNAYDPDKRLVEMELTCYAKRPGGLFERFEERQRQKAHTLEELTEALEATGFASASAYGERRFDSPKEGDQRIHITARRP